MENFIIANCTDVGKARSVNEDSMVTFDSPNGRVLVVCDGMGGQNAGDVASQLAIAVIQDILTDNTFTSPESAITSSIVAANQAILKRAAQDPTLSGMGSTCVMAIIKDNKLYYGAVGDSRIYYVASGMIRQITKDQSFVQTLVDAGQITQEQAEHHANKNEITNALGVESMTPPVVSQMPLTPEPNSICLLCSDGLTGMINNNTILSTLMRKNLSLQERAELLVRQANDAGGQDNITVQLVQWSSEAAPVDAYSEEPHAPRGKNNWIYYLITVLLVAIVCGGAYWYMNRQNPKPVDEPKVIHKVVKKNNGGTKKEVTTVKEDVKTVIQKPANSASKNDNIFNKGSKAKNIKAIKETDKILKGAQPKGKAKNGYHITNQPAPSVIKPTADKPTEQPEVKRGDFSGEK